jgi:hypothetical protein
MTNRILSNSIGTLLRATLLVVVVPHLAVGRTAPAQKPTPGVTQVRQLSLPHLYWHFLVLQHYLDTKAVAQEVEGKDGGSLRKRLQTSGDSGGGYLCIEPRSTEGVDRSTRS